MIRLNRKTMKKLYAVKSKKIKFKAKIKSISVILIYFYLIIYYGKREDVSRIRIDVEKMFGLRKPP